MNKREQFFYDNAHVLAELGETEHQARTRCAREYSEAELWALTEGYSFVWVPEVGDDYYCVMITAGGSVVSSLHGIDSPPFAYRRVVQAELASQVFYRGFQED